MCGEEPVVGEGGVTWFVGCLARLFEEMDLMCV